MLKVRKKYTLLILYFNYMTDIILCENKSCGERMSKCKKYCVNCNNLDKRKAQEEENKKILAKGKIK